VSVLRLNALIIVSRNPQDATWYGSATAYWSAIEMNLAIVCASTPALKPLIVRIIPAFSSRHGTDASNESSGTYNKERKQSRSFLRLGGKKSSSTMGTSDVEQGSMSTELSPVTALPSVHQNKSHGQIHVHRDFEQQSSRPSDSSDNRLFAHTQTGPYTQP
jgi:hypothetical protein